MSNTSTGNRFVPQGWRGGGCEAGITDSPRKQGEKKICKIQTE